MKLAIFDLDGVLAHTADIHHHTLELAIKGALEQEHLDDPDNIEFNVTDGVRTYVKLKAISERYNLSPDFVARADSIKKQKTIESLQALTPHYIIQSGLALIRSRGYTVYLASNSRREFVDIVMQACDLSKHISFTLTGDEVDNPKPHPEIFLRCIEHFEQTNNCVVDRSDVLIFEDSPAGLQAAKDSGAQVIAVNPLLLTTFMQFAVSGD